MDIVVLKTFLEIAKRRHFGQAADVLCISQSTASARIKALEDNLGTALFHRERGNIHLTAAGEALVVHAKSMLTLWARAKQELSLPKGLGKSISIGGLSGLWDITLQDWIERLSDHHPELALSANIYGAGTLVRRVTDGTLDVAFLYDAPQGLNLLSRPLATINLRLVSSHKNSELLNNWSDEFISVDWGLSFAVQFATAFPDVRGTRINTELARIAHEFIRNRGGYAYLPEVLVQDDINQGALYYVPNAPVFHRQAYAIHHQDNEKSDLINQLLEQL